MSLDLFSDIPASVRLKQALTLPAALSEPELLSELKKQSGQNRESPFFLGAGSYRHFIPSAVRHIVGRSEFYTAYTPYQAEASQGTLQAIYEYQSMICSLTGMDVANASMYDGATALAEAAFMACRVTGRKKVAVSAAVNPLYRQVLRTYCSAADIELAEIAYDPKSGLTEKLSPDGATACVIIQQPNFFGNIEPVDNLADRIHSSGALFVACVDPISLGLLKAPGDHGADIVVGEGQSLGNPQSFGGPGLGLFAAKKDFVRQMPGRIVGATVDLEGKRGFTLTLSTREQHIRRERATSNICSNQALCALAAAAYLSLLGSSGLRTVAGLCLQKTNYLKAALKDRVVWKGKTFKEFVVRTKSAAGLDLGPFYPELKGCRLVCVTELAGKGDIERLKVELAAS